VRRLVPCTSCKRHHLAAEVKCPFCGAQRRSAAPLALALAGMAAVACDPSAKSDPSTLPVTPTTTVTTTAPEAAAPPATTSAEPVWVDASAPPLDAVPDAGAPVDASHADASRADAGPKPQPTTQPTPQPTDRPRPKYGMPPAPTTHPTPMKPMYGMPRL
jgi:hypothetical protein